MNRTNPARLLGVLILLLVANACAIRNQTGTLPKTSLQWTVIYNGALAKSNRAVEQSVETLQTSGVLKVEQARPVIVACGKIAATSEQVRAITSKGTEASWNVDGPAIRALLTSASLKIPDTANATIDLATATVNAALTLLITEVK